MAGVALISLVDLAHLAALLGIRAWHPDDVADLDVLRARWERRTALAEHHRVDDPPPTTQPYLRLLH